MDHKLRKKYYAKAERIVKSWIKTNGSDDYKLYLEDKLKEIIELDDRKKASLIVSSNLSPLYFFYLVVTSCCLVKNNNFFDGLKKGYCYKKLSIKFDFAKYKGRGYRGAGSISSNDLFSMLYMTIVLKDREALFLVHDYCQELFDNGYFVEYDSLDVPFGKYAVALGDVYRGKNCASIDRFHPSYDGIFDFWNGPDDKLANAIIAALDYHLISAFDYRLHQKEHEKMFPEYVYTQGFLSDDVIAFPIEIIALYKLREELGLSTPEVDHPLMSHNVLEKMKGDIDFSYHDEITDNLESLLEGCRV